MKNPIPKYNTFDADALLLRIADHDREAFAELFEAVAPRIKSYLLRLGALPAEAEELTQDVMVRVWRKAAQFDAARANAFTWMFVIARNRRIDVMRRRAASIVVYGDNSSAEPIDEACSPLETVTSEDDRARLQLALQKLPLEQHEVVCRSYFEEKSHSEIAAALELPIGTVKSRLRRAVETLRGLMETK